SDASVLLRSVAEACRSYGLRRAVTDQYSAGASLALARQYGLELSSIAWTQTSKLEAFLNLQTLLHSDRIELSPERTLRRDLLSVKKRTTQTGYTIVLPRTSDGRHCDYAPALAAALRQGTRRPSRIYEIMRRAAEAER